MRWLDSGTVELDGQTIVITRKDIRDHAQALRAAEVCVFLSLQIYFMCCHPYMCAYAMHVVASIRQTSSLICRMSKTRAMAWAIGKVGITYLHNGRHLAFSSKEVPRLSPPSRCECLWIVAWCYGCPYNKKVHMVHGLSKLSASKYKFADCIVLIVLFVYWFVCLCCSSSWVVFGQYFSFLVRSCLIIIATIVDVVAADNQLWLMYRYYNQFVL